MATEAEIIAMRANVVAPDSTLAVLIDLRNMGGQVCNDAASLIEFLIDTQADYTRELESERELADAFKQQAEDSAAVLSRIHDHLQKLSYFALEHVKDDPFPEPEPVKPARKRRAKP